MYSGCKKSFASCLPSPPGDRVFTSGGWLLKADQRAPAGDRQHWGCPIALGKTISPAPTTRTHALTDTRGQTTRCWRSEQNWECIKMAAWHGKHPASVAGEMEKLAPGLLL